MKPFHCPKCGGEVRWWYPIEKVYEYGALIRADGRLKRGKQLLCVDAGSGLMDSLVCNDISGCKWTYDAVEGQTVTPILKVMDDRVAMESWVAPPKELIERMEKAVAKGKTGAKL